MRCQRIITDGLSHSDICDSQLACSSSQLFAAYRVLLRLLVPRHPPHALSSLTFLASIIALPLRQTSPRSAHDLMVYSPPLTFVFLAEPSILFAKLLAFRQVFRFSLLTFQNQTLLFFCWSLLLSQKRPPSLTFANNVSDDFLFETFVSLELLRSFA